MVAGIKRLPVLIPSLFMFIYSVSLIYCLDEQDFAFGVRVD